MAKMVRTVASQERDDKQRSSAAWDECKDSKRHAEEAY